MTIGVRLSSRESALRERRGDRRDRSPALYIGAQLALAVIFSFALLVVGGEGEEELLRLSWLGNVLLVTQLLVLVAKLRSVLTPIVVVSVLLFLFSAGKVMLVSLGVDFPATDVLFREDIHAVARAYSFVLVAFAWYMVGVTVVPSVSEPTEMRDRKFNWRSGIFLSGVLCLVAGLPSFVVVNVSNFSIVRTQGYSGYYEEGARLESPLLGLSHLFISGLIFIACAGSRRARRYCIIFIVLVALLRLSLGDRGEGFIYIFTAYFLTLVDRDTARRRTKLLAAAVVLAMALLTPVIGAYRQTFGGGVDDFAGLRLWQLTVETLSVLGATLFPTVKITELVEAGWPLSSGLSYVASFARLIPGPIRIGPVGDFVSEDLYGSPGKWLQDSLGLSYGPGFTPFAEAYLNFGYAGGVVALLVVGVLFGLLFRLPASLGNASLIRLVVCICSFALVAFVVRGSMNTFVPYLFRYVALPLVLAWLIAAASSSKQTTESL